MAQTVSSDQETSPGNEYPVGLDNTEVITITAGSLQTGSVLQEGGANIKSQIVLKIA